jgi:hypothetical protein
VSLSCIVISSEKRHGIANVTIRVTQSNKLPQSNTSRRTEEYSISDSGVYFLGYDEVKLKAPECMFKSLSRPGETWERSPGEKLKVGKPEEVTVPAGKFQAIPINVERESNGALELPDKYWIAPRVGIVRWDYSARKDGQPGLVMRVFKPGSGTLPPDKK